MRPRRRRAGHTLGELMASLSVIGVLMTGLATFVAGTAGSALEGRRHAADLRSMRVGLERVTRLIRTADRVEAIGDRLTIEQDGVTRSVVSSRGEIRLDDRTLVRGLGTARFEPADGGILLVITPPSRSDRAPPNLRRWVTPRREVAR